MRNPRLTLSFSMFVALVLSSLACSSRSAAEHGPGSSSGATSDDCPIGTYQCPCTSGGQCGQLLSCDQNLNICVESRPCTDDEDCPAGRRCVSGICYHDGPHQCPRGTEACPCTESGGCDPGLLCLSGYCVDADDGGDDGESGKGQDGSTTTDSSTTTGTTTNTTTTGTTSDSAAVWVR